MVYQVPIPSNGAWPQTEELEVVLILGTMLILTVC